MVQACIRAGTSKAQGWEIRRVVYLKMFPCSWLPLSLLVWAMANNKLCATTAYAMELD